MKTNSLRPSVARSTGLVVVALLFGGCLKERLAWSPDGKHAALVTADGLHLSDATGRISPLLAPGAYRAAWLPDSQRLVIARTKAAKTFADVSAALGPVRTRALVAKAESAWKKLKDLPRSEEFDKRIAEEVGGDLAGIVAYLREQPQHLAALREKFGSDWNKEDETKPAELNEVVVARVNGATLEFGPALWVGLPAVASLRPAPGGQAVAFAMNVELSPRPDNSCSVLVAPSDATAAAAVVATQSTTNPDWTPDGRSLVYFKGLGGAGLNDDLRLGAIVQREVLDAAGRIKLAKDSADLAGLIFHQQSRVRCLRDGRILFNATPFKLPTTGANDNDREQLFMLDRTKEAVIRPLIPAAQLEQLPKALSAFEVSPDESQVLFASDNAGAWLVTLATGTAELVVTPIEKNKGDGEGENYPAPVWRKAGEITFLRRATSTTGGSAGPRPFELVLRQGHTETVLSRTWDATILRRLIE